MCNPRLEMCFAHGWKYVSSTVVDSLCPRFKICFAHVWNYFCDHASQCVLPTLENMLRPSFSIYIYDHGVYYLLPSTCCCCCTSHGWCRLMPPPLLVIDDAIHQHLMLHQVIDFQFCHDAVLSLDSSNQNTH